MAVDRAERDRLVLENLPLAKWHASRFSWPRRVALDGEYRSTSGGVSRPEFDDLYATAVVALFSAADCYLEGRTKHSDFGKVASQRIRGYLLNERNRAIGHIEVSARMAKARAVVERTKAYNQDVIDKDIEKIIVGIAGTTQVKARCLARLMEANWTGIDGDAVIAPPPNESDVNVSGEFGAAMAAIPESVRPLVRRYFGIDGPKESYMAIARSTRASAETVRRRILHGLAEARRALTEGAA